MSNENKAHREQPLVSRDAQDAIVALRTTRRRVYKGVHGLVENRRRRGLAKHDLHVRGLENLLVGVEREARQLALNEIGSVLHNGLELDMTVGALPPRYQMQHMDAPSSLPVLDALPGSQSIRPPNGRIQKKKAYYLQANCTLRLVNNGSPVVLSLILRSRV